MQKHEDYMELRDDYTTNYTINSCISLCIGVEIYNLFKRVHENQIWYN